MSDGGLMAPDKAPDVHSLGGAYVLDAVSDAERGAVERHLGRCSACAEEVAELRETATRLGLAASAEPPPKLRSAVLARIAQVRQLPPEGMGPVARLRRFAGSRLAFRLSSVAAVVLLLATPSVI
jgi:anti-sigma factor RsiW